MSEEEINEKAGFNLTEILKEESEKAKGSVFNKDIYDEDQQVREVLGGFIISEYKYKFSLEAHQSVLSAIFRIRKTRHYDPRFFLRIFKSTIYDLQDFFKRLKESGEKEDGVSAGRCKVMIEEIKWCGERFAYHVLIDEIKGLSLSDKLKSLKRTLSEITYQRPEMLYGEDAVIYKALLEVQKEIETELELEKENLTHRRDLEILGASELTETKNEDQIEDVEFQSLRQKIITLMLLTFGRLEPAEDIQQERIVEFFRGLMGGGDIKKVRRLVKNPVSHKENSSSIKLLSQDLNFVRDSLGKLGLNQQVAQSVNEIQFLIEELEKNSSFD